MLFVGGWCYSCYVLDYVTVIFIKSYMSLSDFIGGIWGSWKNCGKRGGGEGVGRVSGR